MPRTVGPIQGPGVSVKERDATQTITPADLGWVAWSGVVERGRTDELMFLSTKADALAQTGNYIPDSIVPDNLRDFFSSSGGAGGVLLKRVTDGTEIPATFPLYMRRTTQTQVGYLEADNGGRWGGFADRYTDELTVPDITETTVDTGILTWNTDQWAGGYIELAGVANSRYEIVGNDLAGVLTVASDSTMATDLLNGGDASNARVYVVIEQRAGRGLEIELRDGDDDPENEFGLFVKLDGLVQEGASWPDLSAAPTDSNYWVDVINTAAESGANYYVRAFSDWVGATPATVRPANVYGSRSALTDRILTADIHEFVITAVGAGDPTFALGSVTDEHEAQVITITMTDPTTGDAVSDLYGALGTVSFGVAFVPDVKWAPPFTVTAGGTPVAAADVLTIVYKPLAKTNALTGGTLYPDKLDNPETFYNIVSNTNSTITVSFGVDMATDVSGGQSEFLVAAYERAKGGRDGHAAIGDNEYIAEYDVSTSKFLQINGLNLGLVKFAVPGVTSVNVQKAAAAFVSSGAAGVQEMRYEIPATTTTTSAIYTFASSLGRSPYGDYVVSAQSYGYVPDPEASGKEKLISLTGMIQGREAQIARDHGGYHKPGAGLTATLPRVIRLPTGKQPLNTEYLYPRGINTIEQHEGNFVIWGNRTFTSNTAWKASHQRRLMSYYINVLRENFDWAVFEINDKKLWAKLRTSLLGFFLGEYSKGALDTTLSRGSAIAIKIDGENNTPSTLADQKVKADVTLALANSADHVSFSVGKLGVLESDA